MSDICKLCCCCSCCFLFLMIFMSMMGNFLVFWGFESTPFSLFSYVFWKIWSLLYFLGRFFVFNVCPYVLVVILSYNFAFKFVFQKVNRLRLNRPIRNFAEVPQQRHLRKGRSKAEEKSELGKPMNQKDYIARMSEMKMLLFSIFGFLFVLRFVTWFFFPESLVMELAMTLNVGVLMSMILMWKVPKQDLNRYVNMWSQQDEQVFASNCFLIFVSALIIDDFCGVISGKNLMTFGLF